MAVKPINLPHTIDPRGSAPDEAGTGAVRLAHESMAPVERLPGALPLSPHIHPSGGNGGTIKGAEPPPLAQRRIGTAGNGEEWYPDHPSQLTPGMPNASREERAALGGKGFIVERAHQDTASTLPDERLELAPGADEFSPGTAKNFGMESPGGTAGDLPAPYGSDWAERHVGVQATDLPVHDALAGLPQTITPEQMAQDALGGRWGSSWPAGLNGEKDK